MTLRHLLKQWRAKAVAPSLATRTFPFLLDPKAAGAGPSPATCLVLLTQPHR